MGADVIGSRRGAGTLRRRPARDTRDARPRHRPAPRGATTPRRRRGLVIAGHRVRLPRVPPRLLAAVAVLAAALAGGWLWLRDSSLVAVDRVAVTGVAGPDSGAIRAALTSAARSMTTLDVQLGRLHTAVVPYPLVKGIAVATSFPHQMRIRVTERVPVAVVVAAGQRSEVSADGTLLHDAGSGSGLPAIDVAVPPGGTRLQGGAALSEVRLLAAAPRSLLPRIQQAAGDAVGLTVLVRNGPRIEFGDGSQLRAKWAAAVAVLAEPHSAAASYIDVTVPRRPVAGIGNDQG
jgi:cell division protein FtsQ